MVVNANVTPIIRFENLSKEFRIGFFRRKVQAIDHLSFAVAPGEIFGFLGPNGAGKTTTIKVLMGLLFPTAGRAELFGAPCGSIQAKERLGFLPENPYFYDYLTATEFLDFYGRLFGIKRSIRSVRIERLLELVGLDQAHDVPLRKFSKGMIQRIGIAQALINDPDLVVLDEPMSGLDPIGRKEVRDIIFRMKEQGKTVFFSSHILQDVEMICDRVAILIHGQLRQIGTLSELLGAEAAQGTEVSVSGLPDTACVRLEAIASRVVKSQERLTVLIPQNQLEETIQLILQVGGRLEALVPQKGTLEDLFVKQVQEHQEHQEHQESRPLVP